jgi:hypothetical protein
MRKGSFFVCLLGLVAIKILSGCATPPHPVADQPTRLAVRFLEPRDVEELWSLHRQGILDVGHASSIDTRRRYDVDESLVYTAHILMTDTSKADQQQLNQVVKLLDTIPKETLLSTLEKSLYIANMRPSVLKLSAMVSHPDIQKDLAKFLTTYGNKPMAQDFLSSGISEYVTAGKRWLKKSSYPPARDLPRVMVVDVGDRELEDIAQRLWRGDNSVNDPETIDNLVYAGTTCLDQQANWIDRSKGRKIYDILKEMDKEMVGDGLARQVIFLSYRDQLLFFGVKLGILGSEEKLNKILMMYGDKRMAEDFLNSGSGNLAAGGRAWAAAHGYRVSSGYGSHRTRWGSF